MIDCIVLILVILLLFVSSILIGYFILLILERLLGCIGVVILGLFIVLVLLLWLGTLVLKEGTEAGRPGVILLGGIEMESIVELKDRLDDLEYELDKVQEVDTGKMHWIEKSRHKRKLITLEIDIDNLKVKIINA